MLASSAFVLAALTMTGVYMKGQNVESKDDGYTLDFTALENNADDKMQEISEYNEEHLLKEEENIPELTANNTAGNEIAAAPVTEDDLDYLPQEVGSGHVEIPGLTDQETLQEAAEIRFIFLFRNGLFIICKENPVHKTHFMSLFCIEPCFIGHQFCNLVSAEVRFGFIGVNNAFFDFIQQDDGFFHIRLVAHSTSAGVVDHH